MFMFLSAWQDHTNLVNWVQFSHIDHWMFNMAPHGKEHSEDFFASHLLLTTKMVLVIRSSVTAWNWVTVQWPGSYRDYPRWVSLGTGLARVYQRSWVLVLCIRCRSWLQKVVAWGCRSGRSACQCSDHTPHTATSRFAWLSSLKEASSEAGSHKTCKQFAEDNLAKSMNYWNHVLWSDESNVNSMSSMCDDALVRKARKIVPCQQSSMVVVATWSGAAWLLLVLGSCGLLRERREPYWANVGHPQAEGGEAACV